MGSDGSSSNDFSDTPIGETSSYTLDNNLYWNGGTAVPTSGSELINYTDDANRIVADPLLGSQAGLIIPRWNDPLFADGSSSIADVFTALVAQYGTPASGSPTIDAADSANAPAEDILGNVRSSADIGAVEFIPSLQLSGSSGRSDRLLTLASEYNITRISDVDDYVHRFRRHAIVTNFRSCQQQPKSSDYRAAKLHPSSIYVNRDGWQYGRSHRHDDDNAN